MPPPQPTDEVRRFFFGSFFFASLSHTYDLMAYRHTRSPLGVVCMCGNQHALTQPCHTSDNALKPTNPVSCSQS